MLIGKWGWSNNTPKKKMKWTNQPSTEPKKVKKKRIHFLIGGKVSPR